MKVFTCFHKLESETQQQHRSWEKHRIHKPLASLCDSAAFAWWLSTGWEDPVIRGSWSFTGGHFYTCCGGHLRTHACVLLLARGHCVLGKVRERVNAVLTVQNVYPTPPERAVQNRVPRVIHSPCALICATVAFHLHCWLRVISHWWLLDIHFLCAFHSSKASPKLYSNVFSSKCVPFSRSVARMRLKNCPSAVSLVSTAETNPNI